MNLKTQFIVRNNFYIGKYLQENSIWYKYLNRDPSLLESMEREMKEAYRLTPKDKIEDFSRKIDFIQNFMDILR